MPGSRPTSSSLALRRSGSDVVSSRNSRSSAEESGRINKLKDIKKKQELRDMLISKLCMKYLKGVKPMAKGRTVIQAAVNSFVDRGSYKAADLQVLEDSIQSKIKAIKASAPKEAAYMPRTSRGTARSSRSAASRGGDKQKAPESEESKMLKKIMASGLHAPTDNSIYGSWSDVQPLVPKRRTVSPQRLSQQDWMLVGQFQDIQANRIKREEQRRREEEQARVAQTLKEQIAEAERRKREEAEATRKWKAEVDAAARAEAEQKKREEMARLQAMRDDLRARDEQRNLALKRKELEKKAILDYETKLLDEIAEEERQKRDAARAQRIQDIKDRQAFQAMCEEEAAARRAARQREKEEDTKRMAEEAARQEAEEERRRQEHIARVERMESIVKRQEKQMLPLLEARKRAERAEAAGVDEVEKRRIRELEERKKRQHDELVATRKLLKQQMKEKEEARRRDREESKRDLEQIRKNAEAYEAMLAARAEKARKLAVENKRTLEQQILHRVEPPPEEDVASLQMTQIERQMNRDLFEAAKQELS